MSMENVENFGTEITVSLETKALERIKDLIAKNPILLFMKGNTLAPRCGFSANVVNILNSAQRPFATYDILKDNDLREALKDYANWPTYPQLYINSQFVGGNDIVTDMAQSGELSKLLSL